MWKHLAHPNVVPFLGMTFTPIQLISEWVPGGDLTEHIKKYPSADRLSIVGVLYPRPFSVPRLLPHQISDIAEGLRFLHSRNVVHGDLRGVRDCSGPCFTTVLTYVQQNIFMDASGHARITDFCLATVAQNLDSMRRASGGSGHTARWTAPEILNEDGTRSKEADIFSFAMVMIEVRQTGYLRRTWLTTSSYYPRYSPAQFRSTIAHPQWLWWE